MSGFKNFEPGTYFTSADIDDYIMTQQVMVFAGTAARDSALGTAIRTEGMFAYVGGGTVTYYDGSAWSVFA